MGSVVKSIGKAVKGVAKSVKSFVKKYWKVIVIAAIVVVAWWALPVFGTAAGSFGAASAAGGAGAGAGLAGTTGIAANAAPSATYVAAQGGTSSALANSAIAGSATGATGSTAAASGAIQGGGTLSAEALYAEEMMVANAAAEAEVLGTAATGTGEVLGVAPEVAQGNTWATSQSLGTGISTPAQGAPLSSFTEAASTQLSADGLMTGNYAANANAGLGVVGPGNSALMTPQQVAAAKAATGTANQGILAKMGGAAKTFATDHPLLASTALQGVGGALSAYAGRDRGEEEREFKGIATADGKVWDGNGLVDYKDSAIASQEFKQRAGVAPIQISATPSAPLPTNKGTSGLIAPTVNIAEADREKINSPLTGGAKITGTA